MKHLGDITKINGAEIPIVDVVTGGSPCQDLSVAGKRAGLGGERSGLFMEQIRIVKEMREHDRRANNRTGQFIRPRYMVWENVPGAFSSNKGKDFQAVLTEIVKIAEPNAPDVPMPEKGKWSKSGCIYDEMGGWSVAWRLHDAQFWGVPQRRKRIALVADFAGLSAPEILFERKGLSRDIEPSEEEGQGTAESAGASTDRASYTLKIRGGVERDSCGKKAGKGALVQTERSATLGASQDQTLIHTSGIIAKGNGDVFANDEKHTSLTMGGGQAGQGYPCVICNDKAGTLDANYYKGCGERQGVEREVVVTYSQDAYDKFTDNEKSATLKLQGGTYGGGVNHSLYQKTIGALTRCDYKGVGNQYVNDGKVIIDDVH